MSAKKAMMKSTGLVRVQPTKRNYGAHCLNAEAKREIDKGFRRFWARRGRDIADLGYCGTLRRYSAFRLPPSAFPSMPLLSKLQKQQVAQLARQAWERWDGREAFIEANGALSLSACFSAWRHWQQGLACGQQSLRLATSEGDFERLRAHFLALSGFPVQAARALVRHATEPGRIALWTLRQALAERGLLESYAAAICRRQFRCELLEASDRQLWFLIFTVRNRRKTAGSTGSEIRTPQSSIRNEKEAA
jgi:hypothetical protein